MAFPRRVFITVLFSVLLGGGSALADMVGDGFGLRLETPNGGLVDFDLRHPAAMALSNLRITIDGQDVVPTDRRPYPQSEDRTAILMLVDTSDPRRAAVVAENVRQVQAMAARAQPHHRLGLARFDRDMEMLAPLGSSPELVSAAASRLKAGGAVTQLFRHALAAVEMLAREPARRRVLILFTDGLDEDRGFTRAHVVEAAQKAEVTVVGLGFPASAKGELALQSLELMARDTIGYYAYAADGVHLPDAALTKALAAADGGFGVSLNLESFRRAEPRTVKLEVAARTESGTGDVTMMVVLPAAATDTLEDLPRILTTMALLLLSVWGWRKHRRARAVAPANAPAVAAAASPVPHAVIEVVDDWAQGMVGDVFVIGRIAGEGVDMALSHPTVSRPHAEIRRSGGGYRITNLSATNPLRVNGKPMDAGPLASGDEIEMGDVRLRFTATKPVEAARTRLVAPPPHQPVGTVLLRPDSKGD